MFTTSLPPESQQLLAPGLDPNDPFTSSLMAGSENYTSNPYYPWGNMQSLGKVGEMTSSIHPSYNGMSATLAPSALYNGADILSATPAATAVSNDSASAPSGGFDFSLSQENSEKSSHQYHDNNHGLASGQLTPAEGFWDSFVQDGGWTEEPTAT